MMNLHWSFRWAYEDDFLSNCCFKNVVSIPPPLPGANRVNFFIFGLCRVETLEVASIKVEHKIYPKLLGVVQGYFWYQNRSNKK